MAQSVYIGQILIDDTVLSKIHDKHNLTFEDVTTALQYPAKARAAWEDHPTHGLRVVAYGTSWAGRAILGWLEAVDETDGTWRLRSARAA